VDAAGFVKPADDGEAFITATVAGAQATARVRVARTPSSCLAKREVKNTEHAAKSVILRVGDQ
jgi:hypothetical protein